MAPPPSKRQKRLVVLSSDEEEQETTAAATTNGIAKQQVAARSRGKSVQKSSDPSPKKPTWTTKATTQKQTLKPISSFFSAASQAQVQSERQSPNISSPALADEVEDQIEDTSPNEDIDASRTPQNTSRALFDRRKRPGGDRLPGGSQTFKLNGHATSNDIDIAKPVFGQKQDSRPWAERFGPHTLEELMVHKKKISDVRNWLDGVLLGGNRKRLLILKGPSGAGKTATISTLAKAMDLEVSEWRNPVGTEYSSEGYLSMSAQFEEFLGRSGIFSRLDLSDSVGRTRPSSPNEKKQGTRRKVILLEEFPHTCLSTSSALQSFRSSILSHLAVNTPPIGSIQAKNSEHKVTPLVMVITETRLTTTTSASDSFTAHRLLGSDILGHPGVSVIDFNPIAPTLLTKALDLVIQKEARQSGRRGIPGPSILKALGEVGDVRSAIGSLQFLCLQGQDDDDWGGRVASRAKKGARAKPSSTISKMKKETLEMVTQRESSLGLFHAVGKVVYNKREDDAGMLAQPPHHRQEFARTRVSQVSVEDLIDETGTDTGTFIAALHENYVLSCEGTSFVDTANDCLVPLSDSDILGSPRGGRFGLSGQHGSRSFQGTAFDWLRQDEICFQLAVRGLLFALPDPVKRRAYPIAGKGGGKSDAYKMFYPTSMRLSRQMEEIDDYVDKLANRSRVDTAPSRQSIKGRGKQFANLTSESKAPSSIGSRDRSQPTDEEEIEPVRTSLYCTKAELILERLPYITKLEQWKSASSLLRDLQKITQFHGVKPPNDESSEDENNYGAPPLAEWTTDRPAELQSERSTPLRPGAVQVGEEAINIVLPAKEEVVKMFLSDDDIED